MKNKTTYTTPEATIVRLETHRLICLSGTYNEEVTTEDANARSFDFYEDDDYEEN